MYSTPRKNNIEMPHLGHAKKKPDDVCLIDMINQLQNKVSCNGKLNDVISLPQIVVVGAQSAGKSSVLESVIGREFLPRGSGTVTRRPTIIQLHPSDEEYAEFLHTGGKKFTDFEAVKQEIADETLRHPGKNGFSSEAITVRIYAKNVFKVTFVDMPGIIKNITEQITQEDIEEVTKMIISFIEKSNCIILAVTAATQDMVSSDAIKMAYKVDPERERTLCVLTKLDIMDKGTDARDVLENRILYLAKGYVGVKNRSQDDINENRDIEYSLIKEKEYFESHPAYKHMADKMGAKYLQKKLHMDLVDHIRKTLPSILKELSSILSTFRKELKMMDQMMGINKGSSGVEIYTHKLIQRFLDDVRTQLFGYSDSVSMNGLKAGTLINFQMYSNLKEILNLPTNLTDDEFMYLIANQHGIRNILSVPSVSLESACGEILKKYKETLENCVDSVAEILILAVEEASNRIIEYPSLKAEMIRFINESIANASEKTKELLENHIDAQMKHCNIYHWDFSTSIWEEGLLCSPVKIWSYVQSDDDDEEDCESVDTSRSCSPSDGLKAFSEFVEKKMKKNKNSQENSTKLSAVVKEYLQLVQKQIGDTSIKYINCFLVYQTFDFMKTELVVQLMKSCNKDSVLSEIELEFQRRNDVLDMCAALDDAVLTIQSF